MNRLVCVVFAGAAAAYDLAHTPPLGFNTWHSLGFDVSAQLLMDTAQTMHDTGLVAAGYVYVNSDDGWDLPNRSTAGDLVVDPERFPQGWLPVTDFVHGLGMKAGLYTSKSEFTCGRLAASCMHEARDAALFASWGIDYVKEDSCGGCRDNDTLDYVVMHDAIVATGRPMIQTDEGAPDNANCSATMLCGNAKRVGHDLLAHWHLMVSLIDIGSGLWPFAHNSSGKGGWWNDLDMLQVRSGSRPLARCRAATLPATRATRFL
jgi:alpha-galactosidase